MAALIGYGLEVALTGAIPLIPSLSGTDTVTRDTPLISYFPIVGIAGSTILTPRANGLYIVTLVPVLIIMLVTSRGALTDVSVEQPLLLLMSALLVTGMLHWMLDHRPSAAGRPSAWPPTTPAPSPSDAPTASSTTTSCPSWSRSPRAWRTRPSCGRPPVARWNRWSRRLRAPPRSAPRPSSRP